MKLWIDDIRKAPEGWVWVVDAESATREFLKGYITEVSFDNDLGPDSLEGWQVANWLEHQVRMGVLPAPEIMKVHSGNPPGKARIQATLDAIAKFVRGEG